MNMTALLKSAEDCFVSKCWDEGIAHCNAVLAVEPGHSKAIAMLAFFLHKTTQFALAIPFWDKMARTSSQVNTVQQACQMLGEACYFEQQFAQSLQYYLFAIQLKFELDFSADMVSFSTAGAAASFHNSLLSHACYNLLNNRYQAVEALCDQVLKMDVGHRLAQSLKTLVSDYFDMLLEEANTYYQQGHFSQAENKYRELLYHQPQHGAALQGLSLIFEKGWETLPLGT